MPTNSKERTNVRLIKANIGYFIEVKDEHTENRLAITAYELLLIWRVIEPEIKKIIKPL